MSSPHKLRESGDIFGKRFQNRAPYFTIFLEQSDQLGLNAVHHDLRTLIHHHLRGLWSYCAPNDWLSGDG